MRIPSICVGAAMLATLGLGAPAWAACDERSPCPAPASAPANDAAQATQGKPHKPLNLTSVGRKGGKSARTAARQRHPTAAKSASRVRVASSATRVRVTARSHHAAPKSASRVRVASRSHRAAGKSASRVRVAVHSRHAGTRRFVSARQRARVAAMQRRHRASARVRAPNAPSPDAAAYAAADRPAAQSTGQARSQDELTELDLAADAQKPAPQNDASAVDAAKAALAAAALKAAPRNEPNVVAPAPDAARAASTSADPVKVAGSGNANPTESPTPQQVAPTPQRVTPAQQQGEEPTWLRSILIGLGGVLTLASAVRLFAG